MDRNGLLEHGIECDYSFLILNIEWLNFTGRIRGSNWSFSEKYSVTQNTALLILAFK